MCVCETKVPVLKYFSVNKPKLKILLKIYKILVKCLVGTPGSEILSRAPGPTSRGRDARSTVNLGFQDHTRVGPVTDPLSGWSETL